MQRDTVSPSIKSAGDKIKRGPNSGQQQFDANTDTWPLGQAIPKLESFIQVSGMTEMCFDFSFNFINILFVKESQELH